ncbi:MAG: pirin family protein [Spirochaetes bacterium]|nr:pirin family protein [Spirochaetota bacterium]
MRKPSSRLRGRQTVDGAGVSLLRVFGNSDAGELDPFLLLDHFGSDDPEEYLAGFPWHPHRGIETVTYLREGKVSHGDSMGNKGMIGPQDAQWMTAGSGIIHQEMPEQGEKGPGMHGFQLWINLPARLKMTEPRYRSIVAQEIPRVVHDGGEVLVLAGEYEGVRGATPDLFVPIVYLIVNLKPDGSLGIPFPDTYNAAVYLFEGGGSFGGESASKGELMHFPPLKGRGPEAAHESVEARAGAKGASFLFIAGQPLHEPIAWGGPIVMNTRKELEEAFAEFRNGSFVRQKPSGV